MNEIVIYYYYINPKCVAWEEEMKNIANVLELAENALRTRMQRTRINSRCCICWNCREICYTAIHK